jgi:hypothetical protein
VRTGVGFMDAARGCGRVIEFQRNDHCKACSGTGAKDGTALESCGTCGGAGACDSRPLIPAAGSNLPNLSGGRQAGGRVVSVLLRPGGGTLSGPPGGPNSGRHLRRDAAVH